ncbi:MAG: DUF1080 domain-containing protein [Planctomycetes bacterium]|nr:DUF1080 domain-containing protein [Planctomycetota bacterium]
MRHTLVWSAVSLACLAIAGTHFAAEPEKKSNEPWIALFDGKSLDGWTLSGFGGQREVTVENGELILEQGEPMTGITLSKAAAEKLPKINYELTLEAKRVAGSDFFCGLTFPVGDDPCSLVVGGWGGGVVGLSSLEGQDASENETTTHHRFDSGRWYKIRLVVLDKSIEAWIDDEKVVNVNTEDRTVSVRLEMERSRPLGLATYNTTAAIRNFRVRKVAAGKG